MKFVWVTLSLVALLIYEAYLFPAGEKGSPFRFRSHVLIAFLLGTSSGLALFALYALLPFHHMISYQGDATTERLLRVATIPLILFGISRLVRRSTIKS